MYHRFLFMNEMIHIELFIHGASLCGVLDKAGEELLFLFCIMGKMII